MVRDRDGKQKIGSVGLGPSMLQKRRNKQQLEMLRAQEDQDMMEVLGVPVNSLGDDEGMDAGPRQVPEKSMPVMEAQEAGISEGWPKTEASGVTEEMDGYYFQAAGDPVSSEQFGYQTESGMGEEVVLPRKTEQVRPVKVAMAEETVYPPEGNISEVKAEGCREDEPAADAGNAPGTAVYYEDAFVPKGAQIIDDLIKKGAKRIFVARYDMIRAETPDGIKTVNGAFRDEEELEAYIDSLSNERGPMRAGVTESGAKFSAVFPPVAASGATLNIVSFPGFFATDNDYINTRMASQDMLDFLRLCVRVGESVVIVGPEKCGKTTLLNHILKQYKGTDSMVLSLEDRPGLIIECGFLVRQQADEALGITMPVLCGAIGTQMADAVAADELTPEAIEALADGMTGELPVFGTMRANNSVAMINSLIAYGEEKGLTTQELNEKVLKAVSIIVRIDIPEKDGARRILSVSLLTEGKQQKLCEKEIFRYDRKTQEFTRSGFVPDRVVKKAMEQGIDVDRKQFFAKPEEKTQEAAE